MPKIESVGDLLKNAESNQTFGTTIISVDKKNIQSPNKKYAVRFSILMKCQLGENIFVLGSIEELGSWQTFKCKLDWHEGHFWMNKEPIFTDEEYFEYKYAIHKNDEKFVLESGINRIADLTVK